MRVPFARVTSLACETCTHADEETYPCWKHNRPSFSHLYFPIGQPHPREIFCNRYTPKKGQLDAPQT